MQLLQQPIQRKLSALLGAKVTFDQFSVSPLAGVIEAVGVHVGDDEERPFLTIVRVRAVISVSRAIKGEIVVKSVTIERPVLAVADNLPSCKVTNEPRDDKTAWKFDIAKLLLIDGEVTLRLGTYELAADRILAEMKRVGTDYSITLLAENVRRIDQKADIGTISAAGTITNAPDLTALPVAGLKADFVIGDIGRVTFTTSRIRSLQGEIELHGKITLAQLTSLLPPR